MAKKESNPMGRPRKYDLKVLANELLEWAQKDDSWNLCGFAADQHIAPSMIIGWTKEDVDFSKSYEIAKAYLGRRREHALSRGKLHVKAYDLNATCYDAFMKDERTDMMRIENALKKDAETALAENNMKEYQALMRMISNVQDKMKRKPSEIKLSQEECQDSLE